MVTHDQDKALTMADRVIVTNNAVVEQTGTPREIYDSPATSFVAGFIGSINFFDGQGETRALRPEKVHAVSYSDNHDFSMQVRDIEFKSTITRVYGRVREQHEVCVDFPSGEFDAMDLNVSGAMFLSLPDQHMVHYPEAMAV